MHEIENFTYAVTCQPAGYEHKSALRQLTELYKYDFTEYDPEDVNESGLYEYRDLDAYWNESGRYPFLLRADGKLAGFALIRRLAQASDRETDKGSVTAAHRSKACGPHSVSDPFPNSIPDMITTDVHEMVEFFVMKKYRKHGVGRFAADLLFRRFPGAWKLGVMEENTPALCFWKRTISSCSAASNLIDLQEPDWDGPVLRFMIRERKANEI